ncbi:hypothetical protein KR074_010449 [Drosophila pseudoananassae]|nr:hypothetical protein KR074_010449 [Drosophila pseudoananassae]
MKTWFWIWWIGIFGSLSSAHRNFQIIVDEVSAKVFDTTLLNKFDCQAPKINNRTYVNCQILLNQKMEQFDIRISLDLSKLNGPVMKIYDVKLEACSFVTTVHKNRFFNIYSKYLKKFSNVECPLKANFLYKLENLYIDEQDFPSFVPVGSFRSLIQFYLNQSGVTAKVKTRGRVVPRH